MRSWLEAWREHRTTVPVWIGGLRPGKTYVTLVDESSGTRQKVRPMLVANPQGAVETRISKRYSEGQLDVLVHDVWFKHQATLVTVQNYGLYRAIRLERDYTYLPGGAAATENPPDDVTSFDPETAYERAAVEVAERGRSHINPTPVLIFNLTVVILISYLLALVTQPWALAAGLIGVGLIVRLYMTPYLDGRKKMTALSKALGLIVVVSLVGAILFGHLVLDLPSPSMF